MILYPGWITVGVFLWVLDRTMSKKSLAVGTGAIDAFNVADMRLNRWCRWRYWEWYWRAAEKKLSSDYLITFFLNSLDLWILRPWFFEAIGRYDWTVFDFLEGGWVVCPRNRENAHCRATTFCKPLRNNLVALSARVVVSKQAKSAWAPLKVSICVLNRHTALFASQVSDF